jgi:hypothetical protein
MAEIDAETTKGKAVALENRFVRLLHALYRGNLAEAQRDLKESYAAAEWNTDFPPEIRTSFSQFVDFDFPATRRKLAVAVLVFAASPPQKFLPRYPPTAPAVASSRRLLSEERDYPDETLLDKATEYLGQLSQLALGPQMNLPEGEERAAWDKLLGDRKRTQAKPPSPEKVEGPGQKHAKREPEEEEEVERPIAFKKKLLKNVILEEEEKKPVPAPAPSLPPSSVPSLPPTERIKEELKKALPVLLEKLKRLQDLAAQQRKTGTSGSAWASWKEGRKDAETAVSEKPLVAADFGSSTKVHAWERYCVRYLAVHYVFLCQFFRESLQSIPESSLPSSSSSSSSSSFPKASNATLFNAVSTEAEAFVKLHDRLKKEQSLSVAQQLDICNSLSLSTSLLHSILSALSAVVK